MKLVFQQQQLLASTQKIQVYISCKQGVIWTVMWLINQLTITCFAEDETKNLIGKKIRNDDILGNFSKHGFLFRWRLESFLTTQSWILSSSFLGQVWIPMKFEFSRQNLVNFETYFCTKFKFKILEEVRKWWIFVKIFDFWKIFRLFEKIFRCLENFQIFGGFF